MIITVLTGRRHDLLDRTLRNIPPATVFVNDISRDPRSVEIAKQHDCQVSGWEEWTGVGESMSRIAEWVKQFPGYWMHVEDDWSARGPIPFDECFTFLDHHPEVGQVRLRRRSDGASGRNYLTKARIEWTGGRILTGNAHATWNPTICRTSDAELYPVEGEVEFMRNHSERYELNAQHPGCFTHTGDGRTLRYVSPWSLPAQTLDALDVRLAELKPSLSLETGSGESTRILAAHSEQVVSLEHDRKWYAHTNRRLASRNVDLRYAKIVNQLTPVGPLPFYSTPIPDGIDFALIDGPPCRIGRQATGYLILGHMNPGGEVWVDDYDAPEGHACEPVKDWVKEWGQHFDFSVEDRGRVAVLRMA